MTRPGFMQGIADFAARAKATPRTCRASNAGAATGRRADLRRRTREASRQEMRTFVCAQCHVEYYCANKMTLDLPVGEGARGGGSREALGGDDLPRTARRSYDFKHGETGAPSSTRCSTPSSNSGAMGIHARSGVSCSDCHMPYKRIGAMKVSDHHVRSPMENVACSVPELPPRAGDRSCATA